MFFSNEKAISKKNEKTFEDITFIFDAKLKNKENCLEMLKQLSLKISLDMLFNNEENSKENELKKLFEDNILFSFSNEIFDISIKHTPIIPIVDNLEDIINNGLKSHNYHIFKEKGFVQTEEKWHNLSIREEFGEEVKGAFLIDSNVSFIWNGGTKVAIGNLLDKTRLRNNNSVKSYICTNKFKDAKITHEYISIDNKKYHLNIDFLLLFKLIQKSHNF